MIQFELSKAIERPVGMVFERLADIDGYREWMPQSGIFRDSAVASVGPIGLGTEFYDMSRFGRLEGKVTEFAPPRKLGFRQVLSRKAHLSSSPDPPTPWSRRPRAR